MITQLCMVFVPRGPNLAVVRRENAIPVFEDVSFTLSLETMAPQAEKVFASQKAKIAENDGAH